MLPVVPASPVVPPEPEVAEPPVVPELVLPVEVAPVLDVLVEIVTPLLVLMTPMGANACTMLALLVLMRVRARVATSEGVTALAPVLVNVRVTRAEAVFEAKFTATSIVTVLGNMSVLMMLPLTLANDLEMTATDLTLARVKITVEVCFVPLVIPASLRCSFLVAFADSTWYGSWHMVPPSTTDPDGHTLVLRPALHLPGATHVTTLETKAPVEPRLSCVQVALPSACCAAVHGTGQPPSPSEEVLGTQKYCVLSAGSGHLMVLAPQGQPAPRGTQTGLKPAMDPFRL